MEVFIEEIVKRTKKKYGASCIFHELVLSSIITDKTLAFYRVKTEFNDPTVYQIQLQVFDKVKQVSSHFLNYFHKCKYCKKRDPTYKFICCNKYTHLDCGGQNKFACCHLDSCLKTSESKQEECSVCLNATDSTTHCGHRLCLDCLIEIGKNYSVIMCPICRKIILDNSNVNNFTHVIVNTISDTYSYI